MSLVYKIVPSERKELVEVICDKCDKHIQMACPGQWNPMGIPYSLYHEPWAKEEYIVINHVFGYFSNQKDGSNHESVLCEACYDIVFKDIKIKITEY